MGTGLKCAVGSLDFTSAELQQIPFKAPPSDLANGEVPCACSLSKIVKIPKVMPD